MNFSSCMLLRLLGKVLIFEIEALYKSYQARGGQLGKID